MVTTLPRVPGLEDCKAGAEGGEKGKKGSPHGEIDRALCRRHTMRTGRAPKPPRVLAG